MQEIKNPLVSGGFFNTAKQQIRQLANYLAFKHSLINFLRSSPFLPVASLLQVAILFC